MEKKERDFLERLKNTFRVEAVEHLRNMTSSLLELEKSPEPARAEELIESVFREAHSLKGASRSVNLKTIESLCVPLEGVFSALKRGTLSLSASLFDSLHSSVDLLSEIVFSGEMEASASGLAGVLRLAGSLNAAREDPEPAPIPAHSAREEKPLLRETVRVSMERMDALLVQAEELIAVKQAIRERFGELAAVRETLGAWKRESGERMSRRAGKGQPSERRQTRDTNFLVSLEGNLDALARSLRQDQYWIGRAVDEHLDTIKKAVMLPASSLLELFPKLARDLARDQGKTVEVNLGGADIECDKRILEVLKDPLIHIVRNCIDHGIRTEAERRAGGKPPFGTITIAFSASDSSRMEILVSDDGEGIDPVRVREAAVKAGILPESSVGLSDAEEISALVFRSGVSTSPSVTDISGRGLGMAIVREKVESLGGTVSLRSKPGEGTTIRIQLPFTLATFRGVLVRAADREFILPSNSVIRAARMAPPEVFLVNNRRMIRLDGRPYTFVRLEDLLDLAPAAPVPPTESGPGKPGERINILFLGSSAWNLALQVDEIQEEMEIIQRKLGRLLRRVRNISGAAVLGNGAVVPVLNVEDLVKTASRAEGSSSRLEAQEAPPLPSSPAPSNSIRILVADDSITARSLLKNILETAGYRVVLAVDGFDAYARVLDGKFDLVVTDVDMPRMSGLELCRKIRTQPSLAGIPVVLITAMESREDREQGMLSGADAYIVKSSFDRSDLLEVVRRLV